MKPRFHSTVEREEYERLNPPTCDFKPYGEPRCRALAAEHAIKPDGTVYRTLCSAHAAALHDCAISYMQDCRWVTIDKAIDKTIDDVRKIARVLKTQLAGAGLALVDDAKLSSGYGERSLVLGDELDRALEAMARNILQLQLLQQETQQ